MQLMYSLAPLVERVLLRRRGLKIQLALLSRVFLCLIKSPAWGLVAGWREPAALL